MEAATANRPGFLDDHLAAVAATIDGRGGVELGVLSLDADVSPLFARSATIDLDGTLGLAHYESLAGLFG